jgi:predicted RNA binding protein YcfA (HicA-like mRNA interferase family)
MKGREFIRRLRRAGAIVIPGKGGHILVEYQGKRTTVPFHGNLDLGFSQRNLQAAWP